MIKFRLKGESQHIDDEKLIEEVERNTFIYETKHHDYRNLPLRLHIWNQIADALHVSDLGWISTRKLPEAITRELRCCKKIKKFRNSLFNIKILAPGRRDGIVQKRWKVLREKFSVGYRRELSDGVKCNWIYYEKLQFLKPYVSLKSPVEVKSSHASILDELPVVTTSPFDELFLVKLVKEYPVLYDKKHEDFRSGPIRQIAWNEISKRTKWNVNLLQKRWRVMRDRFVRELRRTQKLEANAQVNCSQFFREMLFLARHVRSGKYEVETNLEDAVINNVSNDAGETLAEEDWVLQEDSTYSDDISETENYQDVEESVEVHSQTFEENADGNLSKFDYTEYVEDIESSDYEADPKAPKLEHETNEQSLTFHNESQISSELTSGTSRRNKRSCSDELNEHQISCKKPRAELHARTSDNNDKDEDMAFGKTIGCMLKKIPQHLKTAVKLKLLTSLSEFEAQHNLI